MRIVSRRIYKQKKYTKKKEWQTFLDGGCCIYVGGRIRLLPIIQAGVNGGIFTGVSGVGRYDDDIKDERGVDGGPCRVDINTEPRADVGVYVYFVIMVVVYLLFYSVVQ